MIGNRKAVPRRFQSIPEKNKHGLYLPLFHKGFFVRHNKRHFFCFAVAVFDALPEPR